MLRAHTTYVPVNVAEKEELKAVYKQVEEEIMKEKIRVVEMVADRCKNKESWNLVNQITGKKES